MAILDSITLPLPTDDEDALRANFPVFVRDPLQPDVLYIQHSFGVDGLSTSPILESLRSDADLASAQVARLVQSGVSPINSISGLQVVSKLTLGYALIALSSANQVAVVELDYRAASRVQPTQESLNNVKLEESSKSLLSQQPLEYDAVISSLHIDTTGFKSKSRGISGGAPMETLSTVQLRSSAEMITSLQQRTRAIRKASQEVERRLDICVKEYERQLTLLKDSTKKIDGLKDDKTVVRAQVLLDKQAELAERLDKVLGTLRAEHRPDLSEVERKWFAELDGMKRKVEGGLGSTGLRDHIAQVRLINSRHK
jgi:nucleoporin NUP82